MKKLIFMAIPVIFFAMASCSTSKITASKWNENKEAASIHFNKILVVGLFGEDNFKMRKEMEKELVDKLTGEGYNAIASYTIAPDRSFKGTTQEEALQMIEDKSIDGVLTIGLVDKTKEKRFVNDPAYRSYGYFPYRRPYYPGRYFYRPYYTSGFKPGHYETNTSYSFETNLYDVKSRSEVYSIQTESFDPSTVGRMAYDYSVSVIKSLTKNNVLS